jgi:hypothetical protein
MSRAALFISGLLLLAGCGSPIQLEVVLDECPSDDAKIYPGICGCGVPDERCRELKSALVHRYAFDGTGSVALDDVGGAHGSIVNAELGGHGQLHLTRSGLEQYVDLPNRIISALHSATFEAWVVWDSPEATQFWERIFDFGVSTAGEDQRQDGQSYLFLAPARPRTAYKNLVTTGEVILDSREPFPTNTVFHVAVVVDEGAQELQLYLNAVEQGRVALTHSLSTIDDVNNWLGRSQFAQDTRFGGSFLEFRIYDRALTPAEVDASRAFGDSPEFLQQRQVENDTDP